MFEDFYMVHSSSYDIVYFVSPEKSVRSKLQRQVYEEQNSEISEGCNLMIFQFIM